MVHSTLAGSFAKFNFCNYFHFISSDDRGGCAQGCTNNIGGYSCFCGDGYSLNVDGKTCDNVDECASDNTHLCQSMDLCSDTVGSYDCSCPDGFRLKVRRPGLVQ